MYALCALYGVHLYAYVCPCVGGSVSVRTMNNTTLAEALLALAAALTAQPAETVTQAVVSVANKAATKVTGQRRIATAIKAKVKALRSQNGGPLHSHDPTWKLIDDGIVDAQGNLIADAKAPTASKTVKTVAPTKTDLKDMERLRKKGLIA